MYGYIYKTTNLISKMIYIGRHKAAKFEPDKYIGSGIKLKQAINKLGAENFKCELVETAETKEELNEKERYGIAYYKEKSPWLLYNITLGGEAIMEGLRKVELGEEVKFIPVEQVEEYLAAGWKLSALEYVKRYRKQWKKAHPDRVRAAKLASQKRHPEKNRVRMQKYYSKPENGEKHKARMREYYKTGSEEQKKHLREYHTNYYKEYYKDPEKRKAHVEASRRCRERKKQSK